MERQTAKTETCGSCESVLIKGLPASKNKKGSAGHPDHSASKKRINRVKGQLDEVSRMIKEREYCPDIIQQIRAATSALRGLESEVLKGHLRGCVRQAFESKNGFDINDKIDEVLLLLKR